MPIKKKYLNHKKIFILIFSFTIQTNSLTLSNDIFAQEKVTVALAPMASLVNYYEAKIRIGFNSLQESLSKYYYLTSQKCTKILRKKPSK